jgi:hypothetical protein
MSTVVFKGKPEVYIDGRKLGFIEGADLSVEPRPEHVDMTPVSGNFSFAIKAQDEDAIRRISEFVSQCIQEQVRSINEWIEDCLRTRVVPPIKGKVTIGKIRWRGLAVCYGPNGDFLGILQRKRILYCVDGQTYDSIAEGGGRPNLSAAIAQDHAPGREGALSKLGRFGVEGAGSRAHPRAANTPR